MASRMFVIQGRSPSAYHPRCSKVYRQARLIGSIQIFQDLATISLVMVVVVVVLLVLLVILVLIVLQVLQVLLVDVFVLVLVLVIVLVRVVVVVVVVCCCCCRCRCRCCCSCSCSCFAGSLFLSVKDRNLNRTIQHASRARTRSYLVAEDLQVKDKILHSSIQED